MTVDRLGNPVTIADPIALAAWDRTIENVLSHAAATPASLAEALDREPGFALGQAARGIMLLTLARGELRPAAAAALAAARASMAERSVTGREAAYADALAAWLDGRPGVAASRLEGVLTAHPHDVLALKLAHGIRFMMGDRDGMLAAIEARAGAFTAETPLAGYVMGCRAFALEEHGRFAEAERHGRQAVELAPRDAWGRHAVAHVMEMTGRVGEGIAFLSRSTAAWAHCNNFGPHMVWHLALMHLEAGAVDKVLALYDTGIRAERTDDYRDIANAASLLARLELDGVDVGDRWEEVGAIAARRVEDRQLVFADLHYLLALLRSGRRDAAGRLAQAVGQGDAGEYDGAVARLIGVPAARGLIAWQDGDPAEAARLLNAAHDDMVLVGGSNAQRDIFEQIRIECLIAAGRLDEAAAAAERRMAARGSHNRVARRILEASRRGPVAVIAAAALAAHRVPAHH
ncbi:tetratricopeptide repeat protein [Prosthecodimorpha staleyi]|uniref:Tetratricopeptide repeat protein 38 n=1 Tax=Prosthecodimorpha staleyi TaxID=2840188 RepID=A0A947CZH3_9HYPH|nr:tetratricopeptide repeat protein [Prosthecodimorpha staleyi]MBT9288133.1 tetratricopeptide repeat protein [Prosthecodimorpha staleyi]